MHPLHSDNFSAGFPSKFWCSSLLCHSNVRNVFRRLCLLLNASNGSLWARNACSFERIFDQNCFFRASSAFEMFEAGLRSLELFLSGQQRLRDVRGEISVPRIVSFGPAAPSRCSRRGFGPSNYLFGPIAPSRYSRQDFCSSNCFFQASSAFEMFEARFWSLELFLSGQQRLRDVRGGASVPRIIFSGQ
jgi:hypothetical protein